MNLERIDDFRWRVPRTGQMRVDGIVYASQKMLAHPDQAPQQVANVACLPGIVGHSLAMPDFHWGYGFPIGGVAAFDLNEGIISPGGVGYDINCGCRLLTTTMTSEEVTPVLEDLVKTLFNNIPTGVGKSGSVKLGQKDLKKVLRQGAKWAVDNGMGRPDDLPHIEDHGGLADADPDELSPRALERGRPQLGTLGSGNHFIEVGRVEAIFDQAAARAFGLFENQVTIMIHSGSRGLGYQVCDDFLKKIGQHVAKTGLELPDRQLACAPVKSNLGQRYLRAMRAAANYAYANRQVLAHLTREVFQKVFGRSAEDLGLDLLYDVCHNIAKIETHEVAGESRPLCVHRKGATRAFGPGHLDLPDFCRAVGQPVLIPGDMGRASFVLAGTEGAMAETFGSTCHGAGRLMSRTQAKKSVRGRDLYAEMKKRGVIVMATGKATMAEEVPEAYKDVSEVVEVVAGAGISKKVARLRPMGVIKG
ncbi:MAG: RtcB family protein [Proteobacteria bacterium]|nr:RtcB family protein [Pseudomonadota bacterium]